MRSIDQLVDTLLAEMKIDAEPLPPPSGTAGASWCARSCSSGRSWPASSDVSELRGPGYPSRHSLVVTLRRPASAVRFRPPPQSSTRFGPWAGPAARRPELLRRGCPARVRARPAAPAVFTRPRSPASSQVQTQTVPVRIVLIGFGDEVDDERDPGPLPADLQAGRALPALLRPEGRDLGLEYQFQLPLRAAISGLREPVLHLPQERGDARPDHRLPGGLQRAGAATGGDVSGPVLYIDAAKVEKWLARARRGRGRTRGYTLYFINWYGRPTSSSTSTRRRTSRPGHGLQLRRAARHAQDGLLGRHPQPELVLRLLGRAGVWARQLRRRRRRTSTGTADADYRIPPIWEYDAAGTGPGAAGPRHGPAHALRRHRPPLHDLAPLRPLVTRARAGRPQGRARRHARGRAGASGLDWFRTARRGERVAALPALLPLEGRPHRHDPDRRRRQAGPRHLRRQLHRQGLLDAVRRHLRAALLLLRREPRQLRPATRPRLRGRGLLLQHDPRRARRPARASRTTTGWTARRPTSSCSAAPPTASSVTASARPSIHEFGHHIGMSHPHDGYDSESTSTTTPPASPTSPGWATRATP